MTNAAKSDRRTMIASMAKRDDVLAPGANHFTRCVRLLLCEGEYLYYSP